jgi:hypothetical protein
MAEMKNNYLQNIPIKLKIEDHESHQSSSCSTSGTRRMPDPIFSMIHICTNYILSNLSDTFTVQVPEYFPGFRADHFHPFSWRVELFDWSVRLSDHSEVQPEDVCTHILLPSIANWRRYVIQEFLRGYNWIYKQKYYQ